MEFFKKLDAILFDITSNKKLSKKDYLTRLRRFLWVWCNGDFDFLIKKSFSGADVSDYINNLISEFDTYTEANL